jgi:hypothetical protein
MQKGLRERGCIETRELECPGFHEDRFTLGIEGFDQLET